MKTKIYIIMGIMMLLFVSSASALKLKDITPIKLKINSLTNAGISISGYFSDISNFTGDKIDGKYCTYDGSGNIINCTSDAVGGVGINPFDQDLNTYDSVQFDQISFYRNQGGENLRSIISGYGFENYDDTYSSQAIIGIDGNDNPKLIIMNSTNTILEVNSEIGVEYMGSEICTADNGLCGSPFNQSLNTYSNVKFNELNSSNVSTSKIRMSISTFLGIWTNSTTMIIGNITGYT